MLGAVVDSIAEAMTSTRISRHTSERVISVKRVVTRGHNVRIIVTYEKGGREHKRCFVIAALEAKS
jgi:hypothetical protein